MAKRSAPEFITENTSSTMHKILVFLAYGWIAFTGVMHFLVDVVGRHLRGLHPPGPETTLYDGLHTTFALLQLVVGGVGLWLAWQARPLLSTTPAVVGSLAVAGACIALASLFMPYWQPRANIGVFAALVVAAAIAARVS